MRSYDMTYTGAAQAVTLPTEAAIVGFRIVPVLASGSTRAQLEAAYAGLSVLAKKMTANYSTGVQEQMSVAGADWINAVGIGQLTVQAGAPANTLRIWLATDCKEMQQVVDPAMGGWGSSGASSGGTNTTTAVTENFTGTAPSAAGDGVDITNAKALKVHVKAANAGATLNAAGLLKFYGYSTGGSRWVRLPDLDYVPTEAVVEPMAFGPQPYSIPFGIGRVAVVPSALTASAGTQVVKVIEVLT